MTPLTMCEAPGRRTDSTTAVMLILSFWTADEEEME